MTASPLADRTYIHLFSAQVVALLGTGLTTVALALLAYKLEGGDAGRVLGIALTLKMAAYIGIAPLVGGIAHRLPRRGLLVCLDLARAGLVLLLPFVDAVWQVYGLIFLLNACTAGFTPLFQATIPDILPDEARYTRALSLSRLAYDLETLLSPALAAALLTIWSYDTLFALNGAAFLLSAALVVTVRLPRPAVPIRGSSILHNATWGLRIYLATPRLRGLLALSMAAAAAGAMVIVNGVVYLRARLGGSETDVAVAFAAFGAGSMLAALLLPRLLDRAPARPAMLAGAGLLSIGLALGLARPDFFSLLPIWFVLGVGSGLIQTPAGLLLRRSCHEADRSAVFSAQFALSHAGWLIAYLLAGWLGSLAGLDVAFAVLAALVAASGVAAARLWPPRDPVEHAHDHEAMDHKHRHVHDEHHRHRHEGWKGPEPHSHPHSHPPLRHRHAFIIDDHHRQWP